jgi:hypothetical protein
MHQINFFSNLHVFLFKIFKDKICFLRCENLTRWLSSFLMLELVKRAYEKGAFEKGRVRKGKDDENSCPCDLETIEMYHQILAPAYRVLLGF